MLHSHEAINGGHVVPGAEQEEREADEDEQAAEVHEEILHDKPPEAGPSNIHGDVLTLREKNNMKQHQTENKEKSKSK